MHEKDFNIVVVDKKNQPLCSMGLITARAQNLVYRTAALILKSINDTFIFRWHTPVEVDLPVYGPVPAEISSIRFCEMKISRQWQTLEIDFKKLTDIRPCPENEFSCCAVYIAKTSLKPPKSADQSLFLASVKDLMALRKFGCDFSPFLNYLVLHKIIM